MTETYFYLVTILSLGLFYWLNKSAWRPLAPSNHLEAPSTLPHANRRRAKTTLSPGLALNYAILWICQLSMAALAGWISNLTRFPPPIMPIMLLTTSATTVLALSRYGKRLAAKSSLVALVALHSFRFPLELILHMLYKAGKLPSAMTFAGMNYDIVTGISALMLAGLLLFRRKKDTHEAVDSATQTATIICVILWIFNIMGTVLLFTIVSIAVLSMPLAVFDRIRPFDVEIANTLPVEYPYIWLPLFLVQLAWFGHLLLFRRLFAMQRD